MLNEAGATLADTVQLTTYVTDIEQRAPVNDVRKQLFGLCRPASTLVEVSALAAAGAVIEIDAVAVRSRT
ncbi:RidA family protein [Rhodococcus ruber]|uniref:RidA family protein n=1 Tax=Rhodococcus ruber TaxID=1830 RepID=UPI003B20CE26